MIVPVAWSFPYPLARPHSDPLAVGAWESQKNPEGT